MHLSICSTSPHALDSVRLRSIKWDYPFISSDYLEALGKYGAGYHEDLSLCFFNGPYTADNFFDHRFASFFDPYVFIGENGLTNQLYAIKKNGERGVWQVEQRTGHMRKLPVESVSELFISKHAHTPETNTAAPFACEMR